MVNLPKFYILCKMCIFSIVLLLTKPEISKAEIYTVCRESCDYATIQSAVDNEKTKNSDSILIKDDVHTESGISINKSIIIVGDEENRSIIQAGSDVKKSTQRVFIVEKNVEVTFKNLIIRYGSLPLEFNKFPWSGGGISNMGKTLIINSIITENHSYTSGGGIWNKGYMEIKNSKIIKNTAFRRGPLGEACGSGGGIQNEKGGELIIDNSEISDNFSERRGGGLFISCDTVARITNSIITGNRSLRVGGGMSVMGEVFLENCQVYKNSVGGVAVFGRINAKNSSFKQNKIASSCSLLCKNGKCGSFGEMVNNEIEGGKCIN